MSATEGPVRNDRSLTGVGKPGRNAPVSAFQAEAKSCPPWYSLIARSAARITPAAGATKLGLVPPRFPKAGWPTAGIAGESYLSAEPAKEICMALFCWLPPESGDVP